jgi:hypothetical protein
MFRTHGHCHTPTHEVWRAMKQRCLNPKRLNFARYGGRGVSLCERWRDSYQAFLDDMGPRPSGLTIERINNLDGYHPKNCRWATPREQANNRRSNRILAYQGQIDTLANWARVVGLSARTIQKRLTLGWSDEKALSTPLL